MKFFMVECSEYKTTSGLIEKHGGRMVTLREADCIELVPYSVNSAFTSKISHPVYSFNFIKDSISLKQLQDLKEYRMSKLMPVKKPTRNAYKLEEDEKMKKYVETHLGNPGVVKFWEDALSSGLEIEHTADSLRHHWIKVIPRRGSPMKPVVLPVKRESNPSTPFQTPQKKIKEEKIILPNEEEMKSIRVVVKSSKRDIYDFSDINVKCDDEEIDEKFDRLVEICSKAVGKRLSKQEVLRSLLARNGEVKTTINHFRDNYQ